MRERVEIEREIFHARQDLEESLDRLVHKVRERLAVRARWEQALRRAARVDPSTITIITWLVIGGVVFLLLRRRSRAT
jgi:hypothetical protein